VAVEDSDSCYQPLAAKWPKKSFSATGPLAVNSGQCAAIPKPAKKTSFDEQERLGSIASESGYFPITFFFGIDHLTCSTMSHTCSNVLRSVALVPPPSFTTLLDFTTTG
jgi:hypothetical protein